MSWSKWSGVERIDADTYLHRAEQEREHEVTRRAERITASAAECNNVLWVAENPGHTIEWARWMWYCPCQTCEEATR